MVKFESILTFSFKAKDSRIYFIKKNLPIVELFDFIEKIPRVFFSESEML